MTKFMKRHNYFVKLCKTDKKLRNLYKNIPDNGGMINRRLDELRMFAGIDRYGFKYTSPTYFKNTLYIQNRVAFLKNKLKLNTDATFQSPHSKSIL